MKDVKAVGKELKLPSKVLISGELRAARSGATFDTINPAMGEILASIPACDAQDVDDAVVSAREAFEAGIWSDLHPSARKEILDKLADLIMENRTEVSVMEALEAGNPITDCMEIDIPEAASCIRWHGEAQDKLYDQIAPSAPGGLGLIVRELIGVVCAQCCRGNSR